MSTASATLLRLAAGLTTFALGAAAMAAEQSAQTTSAAGFQLRSGGGWRVAAEPVTGNPAFVYGMRIPASARLQSAADFAAAARATVDQNADLFGFDSASLELRDVVFLQLSRFGTSDKVAATFGQVVDGIPVWNGSVSVLFERASGDVIGLDTTGVAYAQDVARTPVSSVGQAQVAAAAAYAAKFGVAPASLDDVYPVVVGPSAFFGSKNPLTAMGPTLAYVFELSNPGLFDADRVPVKGRVIVSAEGDLTVFHVAQTAHAAITGNVTGNVNLGPEPNTASNQEQPALGFLRVRQNNAAGAVLATTDASGNYSINQNGPITLFFDLNGQHVRVVNAAGAEASVTVAGATNAAPVNALFNPTKAEHTTAEVACFYWANDFRNWVKSVDVADTTMDAQVLANANMSDLTCNAYYDGISINLEIAAGSCTNTAYLDVIQHEEGHLANERYNGSSMTGAFHEGNADNFAYYINDDPCLTTFQGSGCLRTALQTSIKKCPTDGDESCNGGEGHTEGQALASAMWSVRTRLANALGAATGKAYADALFMGWMRSYNDAQILNVIADHWLALDDDNGNLADLTPNFAPINGGFKEYGWPGIPDVAVTVTSAPVDGASVPHLSPVTVKAVITSLAGTVTVAQVKYSTNDGGSYATLNMAPTGLANEFAATIPGVASPETVFWYVTASSSVGDTASSPKSAPNAVRVYHCGQVVTLATYAFDGGTDEGWTHASLSGSNGDQWQRGTPANSNASTDPPAAFSPNNVWGTDLSAAGTDGMYEQDASGELRSPILNLSGSSTVRLQFRRFLSVEQGIYDQATVRVNNTSMWQNPNDVNLIDSEWALADLDVSSQAANNASVQFKWRLAADGGVEFGGWNVDDVRVYRVDAAPAGFFATYGTGCAGAGGLVPALSGSGTPAPNASVTLSIANGKANGTGLLFVGTASANVTLGVCKLLVGGTLLGNGFSLPLNGSGAIALPATLPAAVSGIDLYTQFFGIDAGAINGQYSNSNGLQIHIP